MGYAGRATIERTAEELLTEFERTGRPEPFEEIVRRYSGMVFHVCHRITRDKHDAEDATQAVFAALAVGRKAGSGEIRTIGPWLRQVARRVSLDIRRGKKRRQRRETLCASDGSAIDPTPQPSHNGHDGEELKLLIKEELDKLPVKYRLPLVLHYFGGMSQEDMAAEIGCRPGTLRVRLHRGRGMLAKRLAKRGVAIGAVFFAVAITRAVQSALTDSLAMQFAHGSTATAGGLIQAASIPVATATHATLATKAKVACAVLLAAGCVVRAGAEVYNYIRPLQLRIPTPLNLDRLVPPLFDSIPLPIKVEAPKPEDRHAPLLGTRPSLDSILTPPPLASIAPPAVPVPVIGPRRDADAGTPVAAIPTPRQSPTQTIHAPGPLQPTDWRPPLLPSPAPFSYLGGTSPIASRPTPAQAPSTFVPRPRSNFPANTPDPTPSTPPGQSIPDLVSPPPIANAPDATPMSIPDSPTIPHLAPSPTLPARPTIVLRPAPASVPTPTAVTRRPAQTSPSVNPIGSTSVFASLTDGAGGTASSGPLYYSVATTVTGSTNGIPRGSMTSDSPGAPPATITYSQTDSTLSGHGVLPATESLDNSGIVSASAPPTVAAATLDLSNVGTILNSVDNPATGRNGWYAMSRSKLTLPKLSVPTGTSSHSWGESQDDTTPDLVNSVRMTVNDAAGPGYMRLSLMAPDRPDAPITPLTQHVLGMWQVETDLSVNAIDLLVRYDAQVAQALGVDEDDVRLMDYRHAWRSIDDATFTLDTSEHLVGGRVGKVLFFAVSVPAPPSSTPPAMVYPLNTTVPVSVTPEPASIGMLLVLSSSLLLNRRRRNKM